MGTTFVEDELLKRSSAGVLTPMQSGDSVSVPGGADDTPIGQTAPAAGTFTELIANTASRILNNIWLTAKNYAGDVWVNLFKLNTDDEIEVGATLKTGSLETVLNPGAITRMDAPVDATPVSGAEQSYTDKVDGNNNTTTGAFADGVGGVNGEFFKTHGARMVHKTDAGAADYNPSTRTSDYIITIDNSSAARAVTISTEDRDTGSVTEPRIFIIKNISAGTNNITISLETSGTIDGAATKVISTAYGCIRLAIDGTNAYTI